MCSLLGGKLEPTEEMALPELATIAFTQEYHSLDFIKNNISSTYEHMEETELFVYLN